MESPYWGGDAAPAGAYRETIELIATLLDVPLPRTSNDRELYLRTVERRAQLIRVHAKQILAAGSDVDLLARVALLREESGGDGIAEVA